MSNLEVKEKTGSAGVEEFLEDPAGYFGYSIDKMHAMERDDLHDLQLAALKYRFGKLRDTVPTLKKLADEQKIGEMKCIDDVLPLLFRHTMYKSYPISLLEKNRFAQLTQWLSRLTSHDLSGVDVSDCQGIDDWCKALDERTPLMIRHSSGTTGVMSFYPRSKKEALRHYFNLMNGVFGEFGAEPPRAGKPLSMDVVLPTFRSGYANAMRIHDIHKKYLAGDDESKMHALYPYHQSSDLMFLAGRLRNAQNTGTLDRLDLSPALLARRGEFEELQKSMGGDLKTFYAEIVKKLKGKRLFTWGVTNNLFNCASAGLADGLEGVFAPDSIVMTGGGAKGQALPPDWEDQIKRFLGVKKLVFGYGMSEIMAGNRLCEHQRYHMEPTLIPFVLDPDTGEQLPRKGIQTGRIAFYDLLAETYWGGFISGDEVTIDWDNKCTCGRKSVHIGRNIERYTEKRGGDDKISCAAASEAHDEALSFLNNIVG